MESGHAAAEFVVVLAIMVLGLAAFLHIIAPAALAGIIAAL